jgi:hypothetical protein
LKDLTAQSVEQVAKRLIQAASFAVFVFLFIQTFYFSRISELQIREIDDLAFQSSMWRHLDAWLNLDIYRMFTITDYGYGWIYWSLVSVFSLPGYLLYTSMESELLITALPRLFSVFSLVLTWYFLRKTLLRVFDSKVTIELLSLLYLLLPAVGFFSMRFGTVSLISLFVVLGFYAALRFPSTESACLWTAIALGFAMAVKLAAVVALPVAVLVLLYFRGAKPALILRSGIPFVGTWLFFSHPPLLVAVLRPEIAWNWVKVQGSNMLNASSVRESTLETLEENFNGVFSHTPVYWLLLVLTIGGIFILRRTSRTVTSSFFRFVSGITILGTISMFFLTGNSWSVISYTLPLVLVPLIILALAAQSKPLVVNVAAVVTAVVLLITNFNSWDGQRQIQSTDMNLGFYHAKNSVSGPDIELSEAIQKIVLTKGTVSSSVSFDYTVPTGLTELQYPKMCVLVFFGDLSLETHCPKYPDFVILDSRIDIEPISADTRIRAELRGMSTFKGVAYEKVFSPGRSEIYQRIGKPD